MNSKTTTRALFLAGMLLASSAFAGADINKCVGPSGSVTLTDEACPSGAQAVKVVSAASDSDTDDNANTATAQRPSVERYTAARTPVRYAPRTRSEQPAAGLSLDTATLKAARMNMQLFNSASRAQRIAGLQ